MAAAAQEQLFKQMQQEFLQAISQGNTSSADQLESWAAAAAALQAGGINTAAANNASYPGQNSASGAVSRIGDASLAAAVDSMPTSSLALSLPQAPSSRDNSGSTATAAPKADEGSVNGSAQQQHSAKRSASEREGALQARQVRAHSLSLADAADSGLGGGNSLSGGAGFFGNGSQHFSFGTQGDAAGTKDVFTTTGAVPTAQLFASIAEAVAAAGGNGLAAGGTSPAFAQQMLYNLSVAYQSMGMAPHVATRAAMAALETMTQGTPPTAGTPVLGEGVGWGQQPLATATAGGQPQQTISSGGSAAMHPTAKVSAAAATAPGAASGGPLQSDSARGGVRPQQPQPRMSTPPGGVGGAVVGVAGVAPSPLGRLHGPILSASAPKHVLVTRAFSVNLELDARYPHLPGLTVTGFCQNGAPFGMANDKHAVLILITKSDPSVIFFLQVGFEAQGEPFGVVRLSGNSLSSVRRVNVEEEGVPQLVVNLAVDATLGGMRRHVSCDMVIVLQTCRIPPQV
jgi:hypothetical protein